MLRKCLLEQSTESIRSSFNNCLVNVCKFKLSAEAGFPLGQFHYGNALFKGEGVRVDEEAGLRWVKKAADNGVDVGYVYERLN